MSCVFVNPLDLPSCAGDLAKSVAGSAFDGIAQQFGHAADAAINWLWAQIGSAAAVSLGGRGFRLEAGLVGVIAGTVTVGLFVIQLIGSVLRRDPGGVGRALKGLVVAFLGAGVAISIVNLGLKVVDDLSAGVVQAATGGSIQQMGHSVLAAGSVTAAATNPAGIIILSLGGLAAVAIVWAALMIRKVLIVVTAVFAPLAFAGSLADITVAWTRRWIETTIALIVSKLVLVLVFVVGLGLLVDNVGQAGSGTTQAITQVVSGLVVLAVAGFAPWAALKMVHFVGDQAQHLHLLAATSTAGTGRAYAAAQKAKPWAGAALARPAGGAVAATASPNHNSGSAKGGGHPAAPPRTPAPPGALASGDGQSRSPLSPLASPPPVAPAGSASPQPADRGPAERSGEGRLPAQPPLPESRPARRPPSPPSS